jgi:GNAT superfamily N-acetyltransferase
MAVVLTNTTYLEMFALPAVEIAPPRADVNVRRLSSPSNADYRRLYSGVGSQLNWVDRLVMPDEELEAILNDQRVEVHVLEVANQAAGYAELDRRIANQVELVYFGLFPEFVGKGLGKYFLNWTIRQAWLHQPQRIWVHTCDLDHPAALPNYLRAGFKFYDERMIEQYVPDRLH